MTTSTGTRTNLLVTTARVDVLGKGAQVSGTVISLIKRQKGAIKSTSGQDKDRAKARLGASALKRPSSASSTRAPSADHVSWPAGRRWVSRALPSVCNKRRDKSQGRLRAFARTSCRDGKNCRRLRQTKWYSHHPGGKFCAVPCTQATAVSERT